MKKIFFSMFLAVISVGVSSCGTDDDWDGRHSNIARIIEYTQYPGWQYAVEDYQVGDIFVSDNPFVATAENGIISIVHVGKATITHNKKTYVITSTPTRIYEEPFLVFGASKSDVIEFEKRKLKSADDDELIYEGDGSYITGVDYIFGTNGKLSNVILVFNHFDGNWQLWWEERLTQRYAEVTKNDDSVIYLNNYSNKADIMVTYTPYMKGYNKNGTIIFSPYK